MSKTNTTEKINDEVTEGEMEIIASVGQFVTNWDILGANTLTMRYIGKHKGDNVPTFTPAGNGTMVVVNFGGLRFTISKSFTLMSSDDPQNRFKSNPSEDQVIAAFQYLKNNPPEYII